MRFCPFCGSELKAGGVMFCPSCGHKLTEGDSGKQNLRCKRSEKPAPDSCDSYYDDVLPEDADAQREGVDKRLLKRIALLTFIVALVIAACVAALYLL